MYPRRESNSDLRVRNALVYPLTYRGIRFLLTYCNILNKPHISSSVGGRQNLGARSFEVQIYKKNQNSFLYLRSNPSENWKNNGKVEKK